MIKDNQKTLNRLHIVLDALIIVISFLAAYYIRFQSILTRLSLFNVEKVYFYPLTVYIRRALYIILPLYLIIYNKAKLYTPKRVKKNGPNFSI